MIHSRRLGRGTALPGRGVLLGAALAGACGGARLAVPSVPHPESAPREVVLFAPPPAQIEHIDATPPAEGCLWADGQWVWVTQRWDWHPGSWVRPPDGCRYSAPSVAWAPSGETGVLYYRPGRWYSVTEPKICPDPVSCPTQSPVQPSATPPVKAAFGS